MVHVQHNTSILSDPKLSFDRGIDLAGLAEVVPNGLDEYGDRKEIAVFGASPHHSLLVHHSALVGLLIVLEYAIVVR